MDAVRMEAVRLLARITRAAQNRDAWGSLLCRHRQWNELSPGWQARALGCSENQLACLGERPLPPRNWGPPEAATWLAQDAAATGIPADALEWLREHYSG